MTMPKSKLGFLLAAVYIFIAVLVFVYARFVCSADALYCGMIGFIPVLPSMLLMMPFIGIFSLFNDTTILVVYVIPLLINVVLVYFIGSIIQNKFSQKTAKIISLLAISIVIIAIMILGVRYFNKSDVFKPNVPVNVSNPIKSGNYCQQDSDCVLMPQYQGCCQNGCEVEAVNVKEKNMEEEMRNIQCGTKDYKCPQVKCVSSVNKQAVCEQNRCVVKEKQVIQSKLQEFKVRQIANAYAEAQGYNLSEYQAPEIVNSKIGEWHLFYDQVYISDPKTGELMGAPGKHFSIFINDNTGEVLRLMPGL